MGVIGLSTATFWIPYIRRDKYLVFVKANSLYSLELIQGIRKNEKRVYLTCETDPYFRELQVKVIPRPLPDSY